MSPIVRREITVVGSAFGPMDEAAAAIARGDVEVLSLITRRAPLDDGADLFEAACRPGTIQMVVTI